MKGWKVRSFREKRFHHYRTLGTAQRNVLSSLFSYGERAYYLGWSPVWQFFRVVYRMTKKPIFIGGMALLLGYCWAAIKRTRRPVSHDIVRFHRREQMTRLRVILGRASAIQEDRQFSSRTRWCCRVRHLTSNIYGTTHYRMTTITNESYWREDTSKNAILTYSRATAGFGISYLLDHDYKDVYLDALSCLPSQIRENGIRILEFGCGAGMNLFHLTSVLNRQGISFTALGTDFSPVLVNAAKREANGLRSIDFHIARNEHLINDLSTALHTERRKLEKSFQFIFGVTHSLLSRCQNRNGQCAGSFRFACAGWDLRRHRHEQSFSAFQERPEKPAAFSKGSGMLRSFP